MRIVHELIAVTAVDQPTQSQAAQAQAAEARAAAKEALEDAREALQEAAKSGRLQSKEFQEQLRAQIEAEIQAARAAQGADGAVPPVPPVPPIPPNFGEFGSSTGPQFGGEIPREAVEIVSIVGMTLVFCVVGFPIARAFARWIDRRSAKAPVPPDISNRLQAIEQAVESVAVEVERISEGQRFTTRVLSERTHEPAADYSSRDRDVVHAGLLPDNGPGAPINARRS
jgi:hypothetical protein